MIFTKESLPPDYSGCQKNVPIAERFSAPTLMPPSFFGNIILTSGMNLPYTYSPGAEFDNDFVEHDVKRPEKCCR
jgi:hypothetical protein